jgi:hypothetical protein
MSMLQDYLTRETPGSCEARTDLSRRVLDCDLVGVASSMRQIGEDVSHILDAIPGRTIVYDETFRYTPRQNMTGDELLEIAARIYTQEGFQPSRRERTFKKLVDHRSFEELNVKITDLAAVAGYFLVTEQKIRYETKPPKGPARIARMVILMKRPQGPSTN